MPPERVQARLQGADSFRRVDGHGITFSERMRATSPASPEKSAARYAGTSPMTTYGVLPSRSGTLAMRHSGPVSSAADTDSRSLGTMPTSVASEMRPTGSMKALTPVLAARATGLPVSTARVATIRRNWKGAEEKPYQASLVMFTSTWAPFRA